MAKISKKDALEYHSIGRPGKIEVIPTKPHSTQRDLSMAYTPGVADPCLEINKKPDDVYKYTAKGNLVAVISNGTAVLGLGDIGPEAGKPVMEGKGLLFKIFGDVDVFDIEINTKDIDKFVETVKLISPTFGGINLEDIKAPECFEIEERLKEALDIPIMHDDQHGTAIISSAGLLNALELNGKKIEDLKLVVNGAGAAAISCTKLYISFGLKKENVIMVDSKGVINKKRKNLNKYKQMFATDKDVNTLEEAIKGADIFLGLSVAGVLTPKMLKTMAKDPIVFAMANPVPEITYEEAIAARKDIIFATGRSDYPNQINNVLGFPFIFRGALDVRARAINEEMKKAAARALADLAKQPVPEVVNIAYNTKNLTFGREYIIPKPLDPRLISSVALAVAKAAVDTGVARKKIYNWDAYRNELNNRLGNENQLIRFITNKAKKSPKRVVFADADNFSVLKAVEIVYQEGIAKPILLGDTKKIKKIIEENNLELGKVRIINPHSSLEAKIRKRYAKVLFEKRQRKGVTLDEAESLIHNPYYFGVMMVELGDADAFLSGYESKYADTIRPAIQIAGTKPDVRTIAGMYIMMTPKGPFFFADTTVNILPSAEELVDITLLTAEQVTKFNIEPHIALLSYSNFGSAQRGDTPKIMNQVVNILHQDHPDLIVDGEMQANFALNDDLQKNIFPFSKLVDHKVNTLIFPSLNAGNIAYKMMQEIGGSEAIGPILMGINKPIHVLQMGCSVQEIVDMTAMAVVDAQENE
ncbi:MAG: NADP-dependent malic enzyme [Bacteroidales bacterium]|nr:NADP-dependent malic enzyme [Bacteroidales bacterium]